MLFCVFFAYRAVVVIVVFASCVVGNLHVVGLWTNPDNNNNNNDDDDDGRVVEESVFVVERQWSVPLRDASGH